MSKSTEPRKYPYLRIREVAEAQGLTAARLARKARIDLKTAHKVWRDPYCKLQTGPLGEIAEALGVSVCDLLADGPDQPGKAEEPPSGALPSSQPAETVTTTEGEAP